jgi:hypothetical protein
MECFKFVSSRCNERIRCLDRSSNVGNTDDDNENMISKKWASFTYVGTEMFSITKFLLKKNIYIYCLQDVQYNS